MCHRWSLRLVLLLIAIVKSELESGEDNTAYTFSFANPSALNFQDIYTSIVTSAEDKTTSYDEAASTTTEENNYVLPNDQSQFVEFHPDTVIATTDPPLPKYILNSTYLHRTIKSKRVTTTSTEDPDDLIKVIPMRNVQRGVLDLLFPESRVKSFKNVFNSVRRMLSHTFRK